MPDAAQGGSPPAGFVPNLLVFGRLLRRAGIDVPVGSLLDLIDALTHVDLASRDEVYYACRALLVSRHEQLATFERLFDAFWRAQAAGAPAPVGPAGRGPGSDAVAPAPFGLVVHGPGDDDADTQPLGGALATWSERGGLADKDFADFSPDEVALARAALERLAWFPGQRRTRRWVAGRGSRLDLRRAIARSLRTGGDLFVLPSRRRRVRPRPLVLLCDVSGSMERYSRMLLQFAHGMGRQGARCEVFLFSTELTRVTRQFGARRLGDAVHAVSGAVPDWSGGTRIGHALQQFHQRWSRRVLHQGPVVLLISDGWDRGDPDVLREQIARLQRGCHRLIWLNPLIGTLDYAPLTRGLQAALPFVDDFLPARTLTDLGALALHLGTVAADARRLPRRNRWTSRVRTDSTLPRPASGVS